MEQLRLSALGATVGLQVAPDLGGLPAARQLFDELARLWGRCRSETEPATVLYPRLGEPTSDSPLAADSLEILLPKITQAVTRAALHQRIGSDLLCHAGGVAHPRTGHSIIFVAPGGAGKTTLVRAAATRFGYLSDEAIAITDTGQLRSYPKPLSVRSSGPKQELSPDELGLLPAHPNPVLRRIVLLARDGTATPRVEELRALPAIEGLLPQTSSSYLLPKPLHRIAELLENIDGCQRWHYAEHESLLPLLAQAIGGEL